MIINPAVGKRKTAPKKRKSHDISDDTEEVKLSVKIQIRVIVRIIRIRMIRVRLNLNCFDPNCILKEESG